MATTTTNFGWDIPQSTDLVKDGATAIAALGQDIDTALVDLKGGTTGQVLAKASNTDLDYSWTTVAAGGGKVLQVIHASTSTSASNSTSTYADTNLTATITPSAATSKVLILVSQNGLHKSAGNANSRIKMRLLRGATQVAEISDYIIMSTVAVVFRNGSATFNYLDSPATTSATTYKTQFANPMNVASVSCQDGNEGASHIVLMEIGA